ncbi:hypothetical protein [Lacticaseibacillus paracasei]|uniref:hypothetical protein n=1 Tax=Lacticaseibacillus paracasei TaxID=1597 RepID=UPI0021C2AA42|nr:hypothetical protein [Lacticaseibacillus paracasei]MCP9310774.1 hypothetical protein [Lacticaseibacillus paracasei]MCP9347501.1 hypothetical protein [Lacticaseibacillus paracasei]MCP9367072.1 hypothetical protein [Lacticaseibacillus paracasei]MCP9380059.1 hypothetical protein [Lacticaseibacillus paracasei]
MRYPKRAYTFSVDYFSTPESVDPKIRGLSCGFFASSLLVEDRFSGSILGGDLSASLNWFRGDGLSGEIFLKQMGCLL